MDGDPRSCQRRGKDWIRDHRYKPECCARAIPIQINGKSVFIDRTIAPLVDLANRKGFKTAFSCSGLETDHTCEPDRPYITFFERSDHERQVLEPMLLDAHFSIFKERQRLHGRMRDYIEAYLTDPPTGITTDFWKDIEAHPPPFQDRIQEAWNRLQQSLVVYHP